MVFTILFLIICLLNFFFTNNLLNINKNKLKIFNSIKNKKVYRGEIFILPIISILLLFSILFIFGNIERRYSSPINIILITSVVLILPIIKSRIFSKINNRIFNFNLIIFYFLSFPTFILIFNFSIFIFVAFLLILLMIFFITHLIFKRNIINQYLSVLLVFLFLIPAIDKTIVNVIVTRDIYNSWENVNTKVLNDVAEDSMVEIILSSNINIEQAISLEVNSILNNRDDIVYFVDEKKAKQIMEFNDFDLWHIELFNRGKLFKYEQPDYTFSLTSQLKVENSNYSDNYLSKIVNFRYGKYRDRYKYILDKLN